MTKRMGIRDGAISIHALREEGDIAEVRSAFCRS